MIELAVYNQEGQQVDTVAVEESQFGGIVRRRLLKQAVVMYQANQRRGTAATKSRGMVAGSTRKLYRQKHTGRARMGSVRTVIRRGGGVAFAKTPRDFSVRMPKKARRMARNSAVLSKLIDGEVVLVDNLSIDQPRTKAIKAVLEALKVDTSCLIGLGQPDQTVYLSARNLPRIDVMPVSDFNAYAVLAHKKMILTREGFDRLCDLAAGKTVARVDVTD